MTATKEHRRASRTARLIALAAALLLACGNAAAVESKSRFALTATATLSHQAAAQSNGQLQLKASLSPVTPSPALQSAGRFVLAGTLGASSLVCYNDTIFRDSLDGAGL